MSYNLWIIAFSGVNNINVDIGGTGFMSMIVRLFLKGLNTKHTLDRTSTNLGKKISLNSKIDSGIYLEEKKSHN